MSDGWPVCSSPVWHACCTEQAWRADNFQRAVEIAYDYRNQMVQYKDLDNLRTHRYHYDCFGRRVAKVVDHQAGGGQVTRFVYGGQASWQVLAEYETFQPAEGNPAIASFVYGNYIDEPIQARRDFDAGGPGAAQDFYYHPDELFSVVAVTNATGTVVERVRYGDYGNPTVTDASGSPLGGSTIGNRFMFTGREYDGETQFSYYRTRYLNHAWGRFLSSDPIGVWGDSVAFGNGLTIVGSSPLASVDPLGADTYRINRQLNPKSEQHRDGRSRWNPWTHTFIYTTDSRGRVEHTCSWGNAKDDPFSNWYVDRSEDLDAAREDAARRNVRAMGCNSGPGPLGVREGGEELDEQLERLLDRLDHYDDFGPFEGHGWKLTNNCKHEAQRLLEHLRDKARQKQIDDIKHLVRKYAPEAYPYLIPQVWL